MLLSFSVENFRSFRSKAKLSMVASKERQHTERIARAGKLGARLLPIAGIYGGNASGKSNMFRALALSKHIITAGTALQAELPIEPFALDQASKKRPTTFVYEILVGDKCYEYGFSATKTRIEHEWLTEILKTSEKPVFTRTRDSMTWGKASLRNKAHLKFAFKSTRPNQLFLTSSVYQNIDLFRSVFDWFVSSLVLVAPDMQFEAIEQLVDTDSPLYPLMGKLLEQLDTGIAGIQTQKVPLESVPLPPRAKEAMHTAPGDFATFRVLIGETKDRYLITRKDSTLTSYKLVTQHQSIDGANVLFSLDAESDGSLRIIDLLPMFLALAQPGQSRVCIVDELDRSLHSMVTRTLLSSFLTSCDVDTRSQLIFTTHDLLLMDQELMRRDEMWITERRDSGESQLTSLGDYKVLRYDKDIRKSYLQGRFGGIPQIVLDRSLRAVGQDFGISG